MVVVIPLNLALWPVGYIYDPTIAGFTFAIIALTSYHNLPDLISIRRYIDPHIWMQKNDSNCTSWTNWFDLARTYCSLSEPEPLNAFESFEGLLNIDVDDLILPAYFWEQSDVPSPWNTFWTEAAAYGGGLELDDTAFRNSWTKYSGAHAWFDCHPALPCQCAGQNCVGTH